MRSVWISAFVISLATGGPVDACELKLLLSWDVSASMNAREYGIQRQGTADAFRNPRVQNAISLSRGGIAVAVIQWAGPNEQIVSVPWTILRRGNDADAFASAIEATVQPFRSRSGTAIGNSLRQAASYLEQGPQNCRRTVVDISGDGASNIGIESRPEADALARTGVSINGLVLPSKFKHPNADPYMYYVRNVSRGPNSFVMDVSSYDDFPRAMLRKLIRELLMEIAFAEPQ